MTFPLHFFVCNFFISILLGFILLVKRQLKKHITLKTQYHLWYIFVFSLLLPFVPYKISGPEKLFLQMQQLISGGVSRLVPAAIAETAGTDIISTLGTQDFAEAAVSSDTILNTVLWGSWITGMCLTALFFIYTIVKIYFLRKHAYLVTRQTEPDLYRQFSVCLRELHIRRKVRLYASCSLSSPVSYGWIHPTVIIPQDMDILLSEEDIRFIFLHELQHYKHRDTLLNTLVCLLQIAYWFNPFIWYGFRQLQKDREIACDHAVIHVIGKEKCMNYGYTIIRYAEHMQKGLFFSPLSTMGGSKNTIRQRITEITDYKKDSVLKKLKSAAVMLLTLLLVYSSSPLFTAYASQDSSFHSENEKWETLDASSYFHGADGSFVLYDMANDRYQIYNRKWSEKRVSPDSTFKIYSGLFALEEHIISPESSLQKWDGTAQVFDSWNKDQTLDTAMENSVNWYFQNLDKQSGIHVLYSYYNKISYGNCDLTGGVEQYWAESSLKISPLEQAALLSDLLENKWDFKEQNIDAVKNSLFISDTSFGKLYGKTGTGSVDGQNVNGWFVGFVENGKNTYCFATNLQNSEACTGSTAAEITMNILNDILYF